MSDLAKKLRELLSETEKEKMSGAGAILTLSELTAIIVDMKDAERYRKIFLWGDEADAAIDQSRGRG